jgi:hypothetical protein
VLSVAFVAKANARARVSSYIDQGDIDKLRAVEAVPSAVFGVDPNDLKSKGLVVRQLFQTTAWRWRVSLISAVCQFRGDHPKLQQTWLYNYTVSIYNFNSDDINSSRYRNDDTGFNVDAGIAADFGENWTVGLTGQNLFARYRHQRWMACAILPISPVVTAGAAWHTDLLTLTADGDLTETKGFKSEDTSQYVGVGAEVTPLSWLAGGSCGLSC